MANINKVNIFLSNVFVYKVKPVKMVSVVKTECKKVKVSHVLFVY